MPRRTFRSTARLYHPSGQRPRFTSQISRKRRIFGNDCGTSGTSITDGHGATWRNTRGPAYPIRRDSPGGAIATSSVVARVRLT